MAAKIVKRTNHHDVFEQVTEKNGSSEEERGAIGSATDPEAEADDAADHANDVDHANDDDAGDDDALSLDDSADETADSSGASEDSGDVAASQPTPSRRRRWVRRVGVASLVVVFVAALAAAGFFGWQFKHQRDVESASRAALSAAEQFAVVLTSIDTNGVDQNFQQVIDGSTGEFKDMYSQSATQLRQVLIDNKAMSKGTVVDSAVKSATTTKVDVLLFVDQWITNAVAPEPRLDRSRVFMSMELVDGRWLASSVELK